MRRAWPVLIIPAVLLGTGCRFQAAEVPGLTADGAAGDAALPLDGGTAADAADAPLALPDAPDAEPDGPLALPDGPVVEPDAPIGPPDAAAPPDAVLPPDGPIASDARPAPDAEGDAAEPDAAEPDAAEPDAAEPDAGSVIGVACGPFLCPADVPCCQQDSNGGTTYRCSSSPPCVPGAAYDCDGPEDCGGNLCCANNNGSSCTAKASCPGGADILCHVGDDCPAGEQCCPTQPYDLCAVTCP